MSNFNTQKTTLKIKTAIKLAIKYRLMIAGSSLAIAFLVAIALFIHGNIGTSFTAQAAANGDYRTKTIGNWNSTGTWEKYNGSTWVNATATPTSSDGAITILSGHTVTVTANVTVDQLTINTGSTGLTISSGATMTIADGTGIDMIETNAPVIVNGTLVINSGAEFDGGGGNSSTTGSLTVNSGGTLTVNGSIVGVNTPMPITINGTATVAGSVSGTKDFTINSGGNVAVSGSMTLGSTTTLTVASGGALSLSGTATVSGTRGNSGDVILVSGTVTLTGASVISSLGNPNSTLKVNSGGTLDLGPNAMVDGKQFSLLSGGILKIGSVNGIMASGATGNIQTSGRSFSSTANYVYSGIAGQVSGDAIPSSVIDLTVNNSLGLTLSSDITVTGILNLLNGKVNTGSYELKVTNASTSAVNGFSASSYVIGNLRRTVNATGSYDFPLGTSANYELATVNLSSMTGFATLLGTFTIANPIASIPLTNIIVSGTPVSNMLNYGYWTLTPNSAMTGGTYTITLKEKGYTNQAPSAGCYCVLKRTNVSSAWQSLGTHSNATQSVNSGTVTAARSALSSFSDFGIGYGGTVLPITLSSFSGVLKNNIVNLNWVTQSEINNSHFLIERSANGSDFQTIGQVNGNGTTTQLHQYSFIDESPLVPISYYRLKQVDLDGKYSYSDIKAVSKGSTSTINPIVKLYPVPATTELNLEINSVNKLNTNIDIIDLSGKLIYRKNIQFNAGLNDIKLPLNDLPKGFYFVQYSGADGTAYSKKFVKE